MILGQTVTYKDKYDKNLLVGIPRIIARNEINLSEKLPFTGVDIWNCYEISWLNGKGKPCVKILQFIVPSDSEQIVESKSVKLYLNSFNGTQFASDQEVTAFIQKDLSDIVGKKVIVCLYDLNKFYRQSLTLFEGVNIDNLDVEIHDYQVNSNLLKNSDSEELVEETLYSNLLKSNCLVTNQPDWASLQIKYRGKKIDHNSLLSYIISFRNHSEFHEQCVEHIFNDIMTKCMPNDLTVYAKYTRRGGIDISPYRTNLELNIKEINKTRDVRQ